MRLQRAQLRPILLPEVMAGVLGVFEFEINSSPVDIICEILDINEKGTHLDVIAIGSDRTCFWVPIEKFYLRTTTTLRQTEEIHRLLRQQFENSSNA